MDGPLQRDPLAVMESQNARGPRPRIAVPPQVRIPTARHLPPDVSEALSLEEAPRGAILTHAETASVFIEAGSNSQNVERPE